jgi:amino acid permease
MLANYLQHQRRNKMDLLIMIAVIFSLIIVFVILQLIGILFLLDENKKIAEELEKNSPPF